MAKKKYPLISKSLIAIKFLIWSHSKIPVCGMKLNFSEIKQAQIRLSINITLICKQITNERLVYRNIRKITERSLTKHFFSVMEIYYIFIIKQLQQCNLELLIFIRIKCVDRDQATTQDVRGKKYLVFKRTILYVP